jgi:hypothetical protein
MTHIFLETRATKVSFVDDVVIRVRDLEFLGCVAVAHQQICSDDNLASIVVDSRTLHEDYIALFA